MLRKSRLHATHGGAAHGLDATTQPELVAALTHFAEVNERLGNSKAGSHAVSKAKLTAMSLACQVRQACPGFGRSHRLPLITP